MSAAEAYFAAYDHSYWQWQDEGNVVAWCDGATIAFRAELPTIFRRLQTQSLPPFGAIVLLLAACREKWNEPTSRVGLLSGLLATGKRLDRLELLSRVVDKLERIATFDAKLRSTPEAKAELAAMVFEDQGAPALPGTYERLLLDLQEGLSDEMMRSRHSNIAVDRLLRDLAWLDKGLDRVDATSLALRLRTGLEQPLALPEKIEFKPVGSARQLLAELKDDAELGGVARLARLLLAAVQMPIPLSEPEELPVGGVSDLSNRGSVDRLLLSELANDGLTLAVRVAMNEALYLRRETPPRPPARRRFVLLDSGLRMWGVPRLFATSVGLALAAGAAEGVDVAVYRAEGVDLCDVDMTTAEGLNAHLAELDHRAHPGEALQSLADEAAASLEPVDVVLVTGEDVYADPEFQRRLSATPFAEFHAATVGRDGAFRLILHSHRGRKVLRQAQFALDEILTPPRKPTARLVDDGPDALPAIFQARPFPLLLSHSIEPDRSWHVHEFGVLTYARDGRLLHWVDSKHGARQVAEGLPPGNLHWASSQARHGEIHAVIGKLSRDGLRLLVVSNDGEQYELRHLESEIEQPKYVFAHQGVVFVGDAKTLNACSMSTGKLLATRLLGEHTHMNGRFFALRQRYTAVKLWEAAAFNGTEIVFAELYAESQNRERLLTVFDSADHEGPIGVLSSGSLYDFGTNRNRIVRPLSDRDDLVVKEVARNGRFVMLAKKSNPVDEFLIDVKTPAVGGPSRSYIKHYVEQQIIQTAHPVVLRSRFSAIGVDAEGRLTLVGRRDSLWPLTYDKRDGTLRLPSQPTHASLRIRYSFEPRHDTTSMRYSLSEAKFADGSRAVLDGRGLLHLRSSDETLPEMTIVLVEKATAGWLSTGETWGPEYFFGEPSTTAERSVKNRPLSLFLKHLA